MSRIRFTKKYTDNCTLVEQGPPLNVPIWCWNIPKWYPSTRQPRDLWTSIYSRTKYIYIWYIYIYIYISHTAYIYIWYIYVHMYIYSTYVSMCTTIKPCTYKSNVRMKSSLGNQWMFRFQPQISPMSGSDYLIICITGCVWTYGKPKKAVLMEKTDYILSGTLFSGSVKFILTITPRVINPHSPMGCSPLLIKMGGHPQ